METRIRPLSSPCAFGFVVFGRLTSGPFRICGAITMKMISSTSTTSTSGVMLMAACIRAGSPSRMGRAFFFDLRCLDFIHFVEFKPLELWYFEQAVHKLGRSPIHFDMESLKFAREVVESDDGRNCDEDTEGRRDQGLCDAAETTDIPPDPVAAMLRKALMIPTTVPKRPTNGAVEPIVARNPRPLFN